MKHQILVSWRERVTYQATITTDKDPATLTEFELVDMVLGLPSGELEITDSDGVQDFEIDEVK